MKIDNDNKFSLLKLMAESELQRRNKTKKIPSKQISNNDTNGITELIKDSLENQNITIDDEPYTINAMEVENNSILLWLWSDSADGEKTIRIALRVDELQVDSTYWNEDSI